MGFDTPKTVTFNPRPADEAQFRSARLGSRVVGGTLGIAAAILAVVACVWSTSFAASLATTWGEVIKLGLVAIGATLALTGLPVAAAMLSRSYPGEARAAMSLWAGALAVSAVGMLAFTLRLEAPVDPITQSEGVAAEWREAAGITEVVWRYSYGCREPENEFQEEMCDAYRAAPQFASWADWSPAAILPVAAATDGPVRRLLVLAFGLMAVAGAGLLGRLSVLAMSESFRLGMGEAAFASPHAASMGAMPHGAGSSMEPIEVFNLWFSGRVRQDAAARLSASAAFGDYEQTAEINGFAPLSQRRFGELLTRKAEASGGRIAKVKSNGAHFYSGLALASEPEIIDIEGEPVANDNWRAAPHRR